MTDDSSDRGSSARDADAAGSATAKPRGGGWSLFKKRGGDLVDKLAGSVKEATRSPLLKQAVEARERGNLSAAFHLLKEAFGESRDELETAGVFWDVAVEYERAQDAVEAVALLIHHYAHGGETELAAQYWSELALRVEGALAEPSSLVRILAVLQEQLGAEEDEEARAQRQSVMLMALKAVVHPDNSGLSPGLAVRTAELARELDPESSLAAARIALDADDLHQAKRERLEQLVCELDPNAPAPAPPPDPESEPEPEPSVAPSPVVGSEEGVQRGPVHDPARNHPLRTASPPSKGLSDAEIHALRAKLPPSQSGANLGSVSDDVRDEVTASADASASAMAPELGDAPELEIDPDGESQPELEVDPFADSSPNIDVDLEPVLKETGAAPAAEVQPELDVAFADADPPAAPEAEPIADSDTPAHVPSEPEALVADSDEAPEALVEALEPVAPAVAAAPETVAASLGAGADDAQTLIAVDEEDDLLVSLDPVSEAGPSSLPESEVMVFDVPLEVPASTARFSDLKVISGRANGLDAQGLWLEVANGRRTRIEYDKIEALAVARIAELGTEPIAVLDLLLNWNANEDGPLRLVRLRADEIDAEMLEEGAVEGDGAVIGVAAEILSRCHPVPLPDPDAVLTGNMSLFDTLSTYEREVLEVER